VRFTPFEPVPAANPPRGASALVRRGAVGNEPRPPFFPSAPVTCAGPGNALRSLTRRPPALPAATLPPSAGRARQRQQSASHDGFIDRAGRI
jgi:hypothetical protein